MERERETKMGKQHEGRTEGNRKKRERDWVRADAF